ncbi:MULTISPECIES: helix-turn-helix domain-containing protein [Nocardiaceae]|uniref:AraC-like DNA-binding protein n=1 Tax=Rhodococcoides corynebacterioides TaxID=53972 RepID=A0ABS2KN49_9NOCA|nr:MULTISPECIES: helix-turn-helix domain-containing protein [Rhodococcus]MBM7413362.1 AraC-like DNA-binding protein [Rhodococcus corynebacterioides]MBP1115825.1 AraC-like DNA-binding protein [Rhodococcus sp. PvP016]MBY6707507.1 helix-turn-helix transcriptional regulator [Rhodococcus sp. BP-241]
MTDTRSGATELGPVSRRVLCEFASRVGGPLPSNTAVARALHISEPHLRRLLAGESTTLGALRARHDAARAVEALRRGEALDIVSARLGYSEPRAFRRAFRRWTGMTPSAVGAA